MLAQTGTLKSTLAEGKVQWSQLREIGRHYSSHSTGSANAERKGGRTRHALVRAPFPSAQERPRRATAAKMPAGTAHCCSGEHIGETRKVTREVRTLTSAGKRLPLSLEIAESHLRL